MLHGRNRPFPRSRGAPPDAPTQAETTSWQAAVVTNGGTVSAGRFTIVNNFVYAEKQAGSWALTDDYWGLWGENAIQSRTSLKQRRLATEVAVPLWTIDRGYTFNGTSQYVDTGFVPSTHQVAMTGTNLRLAGYERTNVNAATVTMGAATTTLSNMHFIARSGTATSARLNSSSTLINYTTPGSTSAGYTAMSRNGIDLASCAGYRNGVAMTQLVNAPTFDSVVVLHAIYLAAQNSANTAVSFRACSLGFAAIGATLTPTQELAQYTNVQAWATAIGANV